MNTLCILVLLCILYKNYIHGNILYLFYFIFLLHNGMKLANFYGTLWTQYKLRLNYHDLLKKMSHLWFSNRKWPENTKIESNYLAYNLNHAKYA